MKGQPTLALEHLDAARSQVPSGLWAALDHREQCFVAALLADPKQNATAAARAAGYNKGGANRTAHVKMRDPRIQAAIAGARAERVARTLVDADFVITNTVAVLEGAKNDREWSAANGSLTLLARHLGMLTDKVKVDFRDVTQLTDEELEAEAKALGIEK